MGFYLNKLKMNLSYCLRLSLSCASPWPWKHSIEMHTLTKPPTQSFVRKNVVDEQSQKGQCAPWSPIALGEDELDAAVLNTARTIIQDQFVVFTDVSTTTNVFCTRRPVENDDSLKLLTTATA